MRTLLLFIAAFVIYVPQALATITLTPQQAGAFVASMNDVQALADKMEAEGKNKVIDAQIKKSSSESFSPYSSAAEILKQKFPSDYEVLRGISNRHGFQTPEKWASTGDAVIEAFIASEMGDSTKTQIQVAEQQMNSEDFQKLPAEAKSRIKQGITMLRRLDSVPPNNVMAIQPHKPAIEKFIQEQTR